jgi:sialic acid synthase SpsE
MYSLIYDEHDLSNAQKYVLSVHETRETAEKALKERKKEMGRSVQECNTRIVWIEKTIKAGEYVTPDQFDNWRPGEDVPYGERYSDTD